VENKINIYVDNLPKNSIIMWWGKEAEIPDGWKLCDGIDTPDLRDRFIVGAGSEYEKGETGGQCKVELLEEQMPKHTHTISGSINKGGEHDHYWKGYYDRAWALDGQHVRSREQVSGDTKDKITNNDGSHSHEFSLKNDSVGKGEAHENRPPYCAVYFIMKIQ